MVGVCLAGDDSACAAQGVIVRDMYEPTAMSIEAGLVSVPVTPIRDFGHAADRCSDVHDFGSETTIELYICIRLYHFVK